MVIMSTMGLFHQSALAGTYPPTAGSTGPVQSMPQNGASATGPAYGYMNMAPWSHHPAKFDFGMPSPYNFNAYPSHPALTVNSHLHSTGVTDVKPDLSTIHQSSALSPPTSTTTTSFDQSTAAITSDSLPAATSTTSVSLPSSTPLFSPAEYPWMRCNTSQLAAASLASQCHPAISISATGERRLPCGAGTNSWSFVDYPLIGLFCSAKNTSKFADIRVRTREKYRMVYSDRQRLELEKEFIYHKYINTARKTELSQELGLTERQIKIWFQNRRAKDRKMGKKRPSPGGKSVTADSDDESPASADRSSGSVVTPPRPAAAHLMPPNHSMNPMNMNHHHGYMTPHHYNPFGAPAFAAGHHHALLKPADFSNPFPL